VPVFGLCRHGKEFVSDFCLPFAMCVGGLARKDAQAIKMTRVMFAHNNKCTFLRHRFYVCDLG
jgi:hypothetical protein